MNKKTNQFAKDHEIHFSDPSFKELKHMMQEDNFYEEMKHDLWYSYTKDFKDTHRSIEDAIDNEIKKILDESDRRHYQRIDKVKEDLEHTKERIDSIQKDINKNNEMIKTNQDKIAFQEDQIPFHELIKEEQEGKKYFTAETEKRRKAFIKEQEDKITKINEEITELKQQNDELQKTLDVLIATRDKEETQEETLETRKIKLDAKNVNIEEYKNELKKKVVQALKRTLSKPFAVIEEKGMFVPGAWTEKWWSWKHKNKPNDHIIDPEYSKVWSVMNIIEKNKTNFMKYFIANHENFPAYTTDEYLTENKYFLWDGVRYIYLPKINKSIIVSDALDATWKNYRDITFVIIWPLKQEDAWGEKISKIAIPGKYRIKKLEFTYNNPLSWEDEIENYLLKDPSSKDFDEKESVHSEERNVVTHHETFKIILSSILHNKQLLQKADKSITTDNIEPDELSRKLYESLAREYNKQIEKANTLLEEADEKRSRAENMYQGAITTEEHDATTRQKNDQLREEADTIKKEAKKIQEEAHEILKAVNNIPQSDKVPISKINKKKLPNSFTGLMIMIKAIPHFNDKEYIVAKIYPEWQSRIKEKWSKNTIVKANKDIIKDYEENDFSNRAKSLTSNLKKKDSAITKILANNEIFVLIPTKSATDQEKYKNLWEKWYGNWYEKFEQAYKSFLEEQENTTRDDKKLEYAILKRKTKKEDVYDCDVIRYFTWFPKTHMTFSTYLWGTNNYDKSYQILLWMRLQFYIQLQKHPNNKNITDNIAEIESTIKKIEAKYYADYRSGKVQTSSPDEWEEDITLEMPKKEDTAKWVKSSSEEEKKEDMTIIQPEIIKIPKEHPNKEKVFKQNEGLTMDTIQISEIMGKYRIYEAVVDTEKHYSDNPNKYLVHLNDRITKTIIAPNWTHYKNNDIVQVVMIEIKKTPELTIKACELYEKYITSRIREFITTQNRLTTEENLTSRHMYQAIVNKSNGNRLHVSLNDKGVRGVLVNIQPWNTFKRWDIINVYYTWGRLKDTDPTSQLTFITPEDLEARKEQLRNKGK